MIIFMAKYVWIWAGIAGLTGGVTIMIHFVLLYAPEDGLTEIIADATAVLVKKLMLAVCILSICATGVGLYGILSV